MCQCVPAIAALWRQSLKPDWTRERPRPPFPTNKEKAAMGPSFSTHNFLAKHTIRLRRLLVLYFQLTSTKTYGDLPPPEMSKQRPGKFNLPKIKQHPRPERGLEAMELLKDSRKESTQAEQEPLEPSPASTLPPQSPESPSPWQQLEKGPSKIFMAQSIQRLGES